MTTDESLTPIGQMLSQLPVDVLIGKILIMGTVFHVSLLDNNASNFISSQRFYIV